MRTVTLGPGGTGVRMMARTFGIGLVLAISIGAGTAQGATGLRNFPVRLESAAEIAPPLLADLDGDGRPEIVAAASFRIAALRADGTPLPGFPLELARGAGLVTPLCAGTFGAQNREAIFFGTEDGALWGVDGTGKPLPQFPLKLSRPLSAAPVLGDVDGDGQDELVFGTQDGELHARTPRGTEAAGFPARLSSPLATPVTVGRFAPNEAVVLLFGDEAGRLHAWRKPNQEAPGFPTEARFLLSSQPALGDLDDDGRMDIVFGSRDYKVYALRADGSELAGFPFATGYRVYGTVALGDLDGDGVCDVLAASGDGKLYALKGNGQPVKGFPIAVGQRVRSGVVLGDLDADGRPEVALGSDRQGLVVLRADGSAYPGFPLALPEGCWVTPLIGDINGDGLVEVVAISRSGSVAAVKLLKKGKVASEPVWPMDGRDTRRSAATRPNPPRYTALRLTPESPSTTDVLRLEYRFHDLDGDPEPATVIQWWKNGKRLPELDGAREVPATATRKHERFKFTLQAQDGARVFESPEVEIRNTPPGPPRVRILPEVARRADDLTMKIEEESADPDGDRIRYSIAWLRDRVPLKGFEKPTVPSAQLRKGQRYTVVVTPNDGEAAGPPGRDSRTISNTAPGAPRVRLEPARPTVTQPISVFFERQAVDPDGDAVRYRFAWEAAGERLVVPEGGSTLPAGFVRKRQSVRVTVTASDGEEDGGVMAAAAEVQNTPPTAPLIRVHPAAPRRGDDLRVLIEKPSLDVDGDAVGYAYRWQKKGGAAQASSGPVLPGGDIHKGETWTVQVSPQDGEREGASAAAEVVIGNCAPQPPRVKPQNPRPGTGEDLVVQIAEPAVDADGDAPALEVVWLEDGREVQRGRDLLRLPAARTRKHGRYLARLTASDGSAAAPAVEVGFEVKNTPPGACGVKIEPPAPVHGSPLIARLTAAVADADGDKISMRYRWYRDGVAIEPGAQPEAVAGGMVKKGQVWTVVGVPYDGEAEGPSCEASVTVQNSPPRLGAVSIQPARPTVADALSFTLASQPLDPDGDPVSLDVRWSVGGQILPAGDGTRLPAGLLRKHQRVKVRVEASDGMLSSGPVEAEVEVANSAPASPRPIIEPAAPLSQDDLRCSLAAPTLDADGDVLRHEFRWTLERQGGAGTRTVSGPLLKESETNRGERWVCVAHALDGEDTGPDGSLAVEIGNSAPSAPRVEIQPASPSQADTLRCIVTEPGRDPDGDPVSYRFRWTKDGVVQPFAPETDNVPARLLKQKDIWQCSVVTSDGKLESQAAESLDVVVGSSL